MKRRTKGFTLVELQMASVLMVLILVATGVIFYFGLASIRYMQDGFRVYTSAVNAMKVITHEVMLSNCYGNAWGPDYDPSAAPGGNRSFYAVEGYRHGLVDPWNFASSAPAPHSDQYALDAYQWMPTLDGSMAEWICNTSGDGICLRQGVQASSLNAVQSSIAGDFPVHDAVLIYWWDDSAGEGTGRIMIDRANGSFVVGTMGGFIIAEQVSELTFYPIAYNCVGVRLTVMGRVDQPGGGDKVHSITLAKAITLRCAPRETMIPDGAAW